MYETVGWKIVLIILIVGTAFIFMWPPFPGMVPDWMAGKIFGWPSTEKRLQLGEDLQGGLTMVMSVPNATDRDNVMEVLGRRVNSSGLKEIYITALGDRQIQVRAPADVPGLKEMLLTAGTLDFYSEAPKAKYEEYNRLREAAKAANLPTPPPPSGLMVVDKDRDGKPLQGLGETEPYLLLNAQAEFTAKDFVNFSLGADENGKPAVDFMLTASAAPRFAEATRKLINEADYGAQHGKLATYVNGEFETAPNVRSIITDRGMVTLGGSDITDQQKKAKNLLIALQSGALTTKITPESEIRTGPGLGEDSLRRGLTSIILGAGLVALFMAVYYLFMGLVANFAMALNLIIILGALCGFQATFTLPGFAGVILTLGMAVDANILIYERIREEKAAGKAIEGAFKAGYQRAFTTILDSNLTTLIIGLILSKFGTGPIRGFGITLSVGIVTSLFTSLVVTKVIFTILIRAGKIKEAKMLQWIKRPSIPFMKISPIAITCSLVLIVGGLTFFGIRGTANLGIDFLGGAQYEINLDKAISIEEARQRLASFMPPNSVPEVQSVQAPTGREADVPGKSYAFIIRFPQQVLYGIAAMNNMPRDADFDNKIVAEVQKKLNGVFGADFPPEGIGPSLDESVFSQLNCTLSPQNPEDPRFLDKAKAILERYGHGPISAAGEPVTLKMSYKGNEWSKKVTDLTDEFGKDGIDFKATPSFDNDPKPKVAMYATLELPANLTDEARTELLARVEPVVKNLIATKTTVRAGAAPYEVLSVEQAPFEYQSAEKQYVKYFIQTQCNESYKIATDKIATILTKNLPENPIELSGGRNVTLAISPGGIGYSAVVGSTAAQGLRATAVYAFLLSLAGIIIYVWFRFRQFRYGFAAVVALFHDVAITVGILAVLDAVTPWNLKFDLPIVAALLTLIGYSVNDTIVVFDRIRENMGLHREQRFYLENIDNSINQTLSRTVFTSLTVFLTVLCLTVLGGEMIRGFALTMTIGVIVGTYSSIFIASPIVVWFHNREMKALAVAPAGA
jgi:SecD/SecF fusion protein